MRSSKRQWVTPASEVTGHLSIRTELAQSGVVHDGLEAVVGKRVDIGIGIPSGRRALTSDLPQRFEIPAAIVRQYVFLFRKLFPWYRHSVPASQSRKPQSFLPPQDWAAPQIHRAGHPRLFPH